MRQCTCVMYISIPAIFLHHHFILFSPLFQVTQLTAQLEDVVSSANEASDLMENEQMEKRELEEKLNEANVRDSTIFPDQKLKVQYTSSLMMSLDASLLTWYTCTRIHTLTSACMHMHVYVYVLFMHCTSTCMMLYSSTESHVHADTHTHTHSHTHTCTLYI